MTVWWFRWDERVEGDDRWEGKMDESSEFLFVSQRRVMGFLGALFHGISLC